MQTSPPLFSVVVPTHRRIAFLQDALNSVRAQTLTDFECIVVGDDESERDLVTDVVARLGDKRFRYLYNGVQKGGNGSRNLGIENATGRLIAFLDDDDWWFPDKLEAHQAAHECTDASLVFSSARVAVEPDWRLRGTWHAPTHIENSVEWMVGGRCPITSTIVSVRRDALERSGLFDPDLKSVQDWDMWLRVAETGRFATIKHPLAAFRQHAGDRTSRNPERRRAGIDQIERKWSDRYQIAGFVAGLRRRLAIESAMNQGAAGERLAGLRNGMSLIWQKPPVPAISQRLRETLQLVRSIL